jgi:uncharacterized repeat protein (TIGR03803 family)
LRDKILKVSQPIIKLRKAKPEFIMKMSIKHLFLMPALIVILGLIPVSRVTAQTFTTLYNFTGGSDGWRPNGMFLSGNTLYGAAGNGGSAGNGTVFAVHTDGTALRTLYSFTATSGSFSTNVDGAGPNDGLILSGNTLYGTAFKGGSAGTGTRAAAFGSSESDGTVFKVNTDGTGFTVLHMFTGGNDGSVPMDGLILSSNTLYGTTSEGGNLGSGTVFALNTDGTGFKVLHSFTFASDGQAPTRLILSGKTLYGTATGGSSLGSGTIFALNTDGTGFTNLYNFTATSGSYPDPSTNSDGANPQAGLILSGKTLYGTAYEGGSSGSGTVFALNTDGTGFKVLHSFTATSGSDMINGDGAGLQAGLVLSGNTLYGTASGGGSSGSGTVFAVNTDGTGFTILHSFSAKSGSDMINGDGAGPFAGLILSGDTLYGTTIVGGSSGKGTVFSLIPSTHP